jgi:hypothetical protein
MQTYELGGKSPNGKRIHRCIIGRDDKGVIWIEARRLLGRDGFLCAMIDGVGKICCWGKSKSVLMVPFIWAEREEITIFKPHADAFWKRCVGAIVELENGEIKAESLSKGKFNGPGEPSEPQGQSAGV